jgi:hypothetical protein
MNRKKVYLLLSIGLSITTILIIPLQLFFKRFFPFGTLVPVTLVILLAIISTVLYIVLLKYSAIKTFFYILFFVSVEAFIVPRIGFSLERPVSKLYYSLNAKSFNIVINMVRTNSIHNISTDFNKSYKIIRKDGTKFEDKDLVETCKKLNFRQLTARDNLVILFDYSSFNGFGYIVEYYPQDALLVNKKSLRKTKVSENIYFFRY